MKKILIPTFLATLVTSLCVQAAVNPAALVKVTAGHDVKCVEYYNYKGELYCSTTAQSSQSVDPHIKDYETQKIIFDDRAWQAVWGKQEASITTVEYVPNGDNIEQWHELITSQFIPNIQNQMTLREYVDSVIKNMKNSGFKPVINIIEDTPDQILFEFRINAPDNLKQDELQKVVKGKDGFYLLHYVIKKADMGKKNRDIWLHNLKQSQLK